MVRNLATNPRFLRAAPGTSVVRRNLALNPTGSQLLTTAASFRISQGRWFGNGVTGTYTVVSGMTDGPEGLATAVRKTWTSDAATNGDTGFNLSPGGSTTSSTSGVPVKAGTKMAVSLYARATASTGTKGPSKFEAWFHASNGDYLSRATFPSGLSEVANRGWQRAGAVLDIPDRAAFMTLVFDIDEGTPWKSGDTLDVTGFLVEERGFVLPFFHGSVVDDTGLAYSWEGTAHASVSQVRASATEVRRNLAPDPRSTGASSNWMGGIAQEASNVDDSRFPSGRAWKTTVSAGAAGGGGRAATGTGRNVPVIAGQTYTFSIYGLASQAREMDIEVRFYTSSGAQLTGQDLYMPARIATPANTPVRVAVTGVVPATATMAYICAITYQGTGPNQWVAGDFLLGSSPLAELGSGSVGAYFDGNTTPDSDFAPAWLGTADASSSILLGTNLQGVAHTASVFCVRSMQWPGRASSLRMIPRGSNSDSYASLSGDTGAIRLGMEVGKTYTAIARGRLIAPLIGAGSGVGRPRSIRVFYRVNGAYTYSESPQVPNVAGEAEIRVVFTIPENATEAFVRLNNGGALDQGEVWWSDVAVVPGAYYGPYFDGDTYGASWEGTRHNSTSEKILPALAVWDSAKQIERWLEIPLTVDGG